MTLKSISADNSLKKGGTLRNRLLFTILPTVLLPLIIATGIDYKLSENRIKTSVYRDLEADTQLASTEINSFIQDSFELSDLVVSNPDLVQSIQEGQKQAQELKLNEQSIPEVEKKFADTKLVKINNKLNSYLQEIVKSGQAAEIFYTDRNGYNVAFSNTTSDFVQRDEGWWQTSKAKEKHIDEAEFDESANANVIAFSQAIKEPKTGQFLGVIKTAIHTTKLERDLNTRLRRENALPTHYQIINSSDGSLFFEVKSAEEEKAIDQNLDSQDKKSKAGQLIGESNIIKVAQILTKVVNDEVKLADAKQFVAEEAGFSEVNFYQKSMLNQGGMVATFKYQDRVYSLATVPNTNLVSIGIVDYREVTALSTSLLITLATTSIILGIITTGLIILLGQQLSKPLTNLSATTNEVVKGNFDVLAPVEGPLETRILASNFNQLVSQVTDSLKEQKAIADEQRQEKEKLETAIFTLIDEVADATDGDLTVRANLDSMELSTVADLFNAIIDNLHEIAIEAQQSTSKVGSSLRRNETEMRMLAEKAMTEAEETRNTLMSIEQLSQSIQAVANNANQAEQIADDTYNTIVDSTNNMDLTVESMLALRTTVSETEEKMRRLEESSHKISEAVALIEAIALKTNVLAINAGAEADRAGEYGQGFAIVAEQVSLLAKQSSAALQEIARTVTVIQTETEEINQAMTSGTTQVLETSKLVQSTKETLAMALEKSRTINQLMESISQSTISQTTTSQNVTDLMQKIAELSETTSSSSTRVARSIVETANVAERLESTVSQFKVAKSV
ncbi:MAG: methyl-accepting chemotaxis protein [Cyanobacteria bacterium P01_G01_bin.19]